MTVAQPAARLAALAAALVLLWSAGTWATVQGLSRGVGARSVAAVRLREPPPAARPGPLAADVAASAGHAGAVSAQDLCPGDQGANFTAADCPNGSCFAGAPNGCGSRSVSFGSAARGGRGEGSGHAGSAAAAAPATRSPSAAAPLHAQRHQVAVIAAEIVPEKWPAGARWRRALLPCAAPLAPATEGPAPALRPAGVDFTNACNQHDTCYFTLGARLRQSSSGSTRAARAARASGGRPVGLQPLLWPSMRAGADREACNREFRDMMLAECEDSLK